MVRSTFPMIYADGYSKSCIVAAPKAMLRRSHPARAQPLRPAILLNWRHSHRRARTPMLVRGRLASFPFPKAVHEKWLRSAGASTTAKWAERRAQAAMVTVLRALLWRQL